MRKLRLEKMRKLFILLLFLVPCLAMGQQFTLSARQEKLKSVFARIEAQSSFKFLYSEEAIASSDPVSFNVSNVSIDSLLKQCLANQSFSFLINGRNIVIRRRESVVLAKSDKEIKGRIVNKKAEPAAGVTILCLQNSKQSTSAADGSFALQAPDGAITLQVTGAEIETQIVKVSQNETVLIKVANKINELDQVILMGYGQTTRRLNTGNIAKVTSETIARQPVNNPLAALQGQVAGLIITQSNGYASSPFNVQLRGQNSIGQNSQPLFVLDGIPFAPQNTPVNQFNSASVSGLSPFYTINPSDIESIEVLKDADATAIYGSRGSNGVILITTKKGQAGRVQLRALTQAGWSKITRTMPMLNTTQYIAMRNEAFRNDGLTPTLSTAADLVVWDTTRYTNFKELFIGNTAGSYDAQVSVSGGSTNINFSFGGSYHRETTVLPIDRADQRVSFHQSLQFRSTNRKFQIDLSNTFTSTQNNLPSVDAASLINRPPNLKLYDSVGNLNWQEGGVRFGSTTAEYGNPLAAFHTIYEARLHNLISSLQLRFQFNDHFYVKANLGYNTLRTDEYSASPMRANDPTDPNQRSRANFGNRSDQTWIIEPQMVYQGNAAFGKWSVLIGSTLQSKSQQSMYSSGQNYTSDLLLRSLSGAGTITSFNNSNDYRYTGVFSRVSYSFADRYLLNITARRDGSSRFGPENRFHSFGAIGVGWIFSNDPTIRTLLPWLSFGKFRASYGTTGNDGIGDYQYVERWTNPGGRAYQGVPVLSPASLFNPVLAWEINRKLEVGLELGVANRVNFTVSAFRNRSGNQLIPYALPYQTGFPSVLMNRAAHVQNAGLEWTIETKNVQNADFRWTSNLNLSFTRNKLLAFPELEASSYGSVLVIGQPLALRKLLHFTGVDPVTGLYTFQDVNRDGIINTQDRTSYKTIQPVYYGGLQNVINWKRLELMLFFQFTKQNGVNYLNGLSSSAGLPGNRYKNQPIIALERWQSPNDIATVQRFTTIVNTGDMASSDATYSDASFIRCKTISISYDMSNNFLKKKGVSSFRFFLQGQNLFVITGYRGADPESQNLFTLPPLRNFTTGIQLTF